MAGVPIFSEANEKLRFLKAFVYALKDATGIGQTLVTSYQLLNNSKIIQLLKRCEMFILIYFCSILFLTTGVV